MNLIPYSKPKTNNKLTTLWLTWCQTKRKQSQKPNIPSERTSDGSEPEAGKMFAGLMEVMESD